MVVVALMVTATTASVAAAEDEDSGWEVLYTSVDNAQVEGRILLYHHDDGTDQFVSDARLCWAEIDPCIHGVIPQVELQMRIYKRRPQGGYDLVAWTAWKDNTDVIRVNVPETPTNGPGYYSAATWVSFLDEHGITRHRAVGLENWHWLE